ncbi:uncharacterized protein LOC130642167 [Hydractinia symbiolongicarpus]|uniref:uncharacterized protein LOC130642167 n=1 Tax=Hydractinia symbiolongicarpus TaxID=13093 RepID=UPI0025504583|nr:uncharacterized protein LOC130642167 [Hydractinia symbiolongicarpus]
METSSYCTYLKKRKLYFGWVSKCYLPRSQMSYFTGTSVAYPYLSNCVSSSPFEQYGGETRLKPNAVTLPQHAAINTAYKIETTCGENIFQSPKCSQINATYQPTEFETTQGLLTITEVNGSNMQYTPEKIESDNNSSIETKRKLNFCDAKPVQSSTKRRRRKRSVSESVLQTRRTINNERERHRIQRMSEAFRILQNTLPDEMKKKTMRKIDILNAAMNYISHLNSCL